MARVNTEKTKRQACCKPLTWYVCVDSGLHVQQGLHVQSTASRGAGRQRPWISNFVLGVMLSGCKDADLCEMTTDVFYVQNVPKFMLFRNMEVCSKQTCLAPFQL
jgi:hypothetical protein